MPSKLSLPLFGPVAVPAVCIVAVFSGVALATPSTTGSTDFYSTAGQIFAGFLIAVAVESGATLRAEPSSPAELACVHVCLGLTFIFTFGGGGVVVGTLLLDNPADAALANIVTGGLAAASVALAIPFVLTWIRLHGRINETANRREVDT